MITAFHIVFYSLTYHSTPCSLRYWHTFIIQSTKNSAPNDTDTDTI